MDDLTFQPEANLTRFRGRFVKHKEPTSEIYGNLHRKIGMIWLSLMRFSRGFVSGSAATFSDQSWSTAGWPTQYINHFTVSLVFVSVLLNSMKSCEISDSFVIFDEASHQDLGGRVAAPASGLAALGSWRPASESAEWSRWVVDLEGRPNAWQLRAVWGCLRLKEKRHSSAKW